MYVWERERETEEAKESPLRCSWVAWSMKFSQPITGRRLEVVGVYGQESAPATGSPTTAGHGGAAYLRCFSHRFMLPFCCPAPADRWSFFIAQRRRRRWREERARATCRRTLFWSIFGRRWVREPWDHPACGVMKMYQARQRQTFLSMTAIHTIIHTHTSTNDPRNRWKVEFKLVLCS